MAHITPPALVLVIPHKLLYRRYEGSNCTHTVEAEFQMTPDVLEEFRTNPAVFFIEGDEE